MRGSARLVSLVIELVALVAAAPAADDAAAPRRDAAALIAALAPLDDQQNAPERVRLLLALLELRRQEFGTEHEETARVLVDLVRARLWTQEFDTAEAEAREAHRILAAQLGEGSAETAEALRTLATVTIRTGRASEAEPLLRRSIELARAARGGADHWSIAYALDDLGELLTNAGDFEAAEEAFLESIAIRKRLFGESDVQVARGLEGYARMLHVRGDYDGAVRQLRDAIALHEHAGASPISIATCKQGLAAALTAGGELLEAETLLVATVAILREQYGEEHLLVAQNLALLGTVCGNRGDYAIAIDYLERAIAIRRRSLGDRHPLVSDSILRLVDVHRAQGNLDEAELRCREALAIERFVRGAEHAAVAACLSRLAGLLRDRGSLDEALPLMEEALAMRRRVLPPGHPQFASSLNNLAELLARLGRADEAEPLLREAIAIFRGAWGDDHPFVAASLHTLAWLEAQSDRLAEADSLYGEAIEILRRAGTPGLHRSCTERALVLLELGRPDEAEALLDEAIESIERLRGRGTGDETDRARLFGHLTQHDPFEVMVRLRLDAGDAAGAFAYLERGRARSLLDLLARGTGAAAAPLDTAGVAAALGPREILLAYDVSERDGVLLVLRAGGRIDGFRLELPEDRATASFELYEALVPAALRAELAAASRVVIVGDGPLAALPFEALPLRGVPEESDERWIDTYPPIVRTPSGSVLAERRQRSHEGGVAGPALVAVGAPRLEVPLPSTADEVSAIAALARRASASDEAIVVLTGDEATLSNVRAASAHSRLLHFATHGMVEEARSARDSAIALTATHGTDDGMLRLGELLDDWTGRLEGTELVTLSACSTARGTPARGEGFVALSWGFMHAGAGGVVASLWKVDDRATALLMERFYANVLGASGAPMGKAEALHDAKRWLRELSAGEMDGRASALRGMALAPGVEAAAPSAQSFADPFYWAAFVLIGDG